VKANTSIISKAHEKKKKRKKHVRYHYFTWKAASKSNYKRTGEKSPERQQKEDKRVEEKRPTFLLI